MSTVTQQQIEELRASFLAKQQTEDIPSDVGSFHPNDMERLRDENFLKRFLEHHEGDVKLATQMIWDSLVWRKTFGANDISEDNIPMDYIKEGAFFTRGKDINGKTLFVFKTIKHKKGARDTDGLKRCLVYWLERLERSEKNDQITVFFDMEGTGLSNMDIDFTKYLINLFKFYYPNFLNYIVIYEMPWVLNAAFKVIKSLLPARAVAKMRFLNKASLKEIVPPEQALKCWGGEDDYEFIFEAEQRGTNDSTVKKVTFAESDQVNNVDHNDNKNGANMIALNPPVHLTFAKSGNDVTSAFNITNNDDALITFKIKTTSPEKFRVRPNIGTLATGVSQTINVSIQHGYSVPPSFGSDKFLVMCMPLVNADASAVELAELWKNAQSDKIEQHRLRCAYQSSDLAKNGIMRQNSLTETEKTTIQISQSLAELKEAHRQMRSEIRTLKILIFLTFLMTVIILAFAYFFQVGNVSKACLEA